MGYFLHLPDTFTAAFEVLLTILLVRSFVHCVYGLETVVSVLFTNTRTRWPHNEREIFNTVRGVAECSIENFEFIVLPTSACICKQNTN